jgi:ribosomal-protein-alanine N-acetyltransferase
VIQKLPSLERPGDEPVAPIMSEPEAALEATTDWRDGVPVLSGSLVTLRELREDDAAALFIALSTDEATRFISPPPSSVEGFERFIRWTRRERVAGRHVCFAIVPRGFDTAMGLFQIRSLESEFSTAEWGFALAPELWGTGAFTDGARLAIGFAFETLLTHRLEARAVMTNGRGNAALRKLGALREGTLRKAFLRHGDYHDQALWTILASEWREAQQGICISSTIH